MMVSAETIFFAVIAGSAASMRRGTKGRAPARLESRVWSAETQLVHLETQSLAR